jgi:hypothetical protein
MKSVLSAAAGAVIVGVEAIGAAQASSDCQSRDGISAQAGCATTTDVSSSKKKKARVRKGSGASPAGTGGGVGGESGSGATTEKVKPRGKASTPAQ